MIEPLLTMVASDAARSLVGLVAQYRQAAARQAAAQHASAGEARILRKIQEIAQISPDEIELLASVVSNDDKMQTPETTGAIALYRRDTVFTVASRRIELVFKIRLAVALFIFTLLVVTVLLAIIGLIIGNRGLAVGLGSAAVVDLLAAGIYKPLDKVATTLRDTQRLDMIHSMTEEQLSTCRDQDPAQRFNCQQKIWSEALDRLAALEGKSTQASST